MTNDINYADSLAEVLYYLQGIKKEYIKKIPISFMKYLAENATKQYQCKFDYKKPLSEISISDDAKGIIGIIALNYWCDNIEQKKNLLNKWDENNAKQRKTDANSIKEKYNIQKENLEEATQNYLQETKPKHIHIQKYNIQGKATKRKHQLETNQLRKKRESNQSLALRPYKQSLITRIFDKLNEIFKKWADINQPNCKPISKKKLKK